MPAEPAPSSLLGHTPKPGMVLVAVIDVVADSGDVLRATRGDDDFGNVVV